MHELLDPALTDTQAITAEDCLTVASSRRINKGIALQTPSYPFCLLFYYHWAKLAEVQVYPPMVRLCGQNRPNGGKQLEDGRSSGNVSNVVI